MFDIDTIGKRIRELRKENGLTQAAFANAIHVSFQAVSNWERGITPPDLENLVTIAKYFKVLVDDLLRPAKDGLFLGIDGGGTKTEFVLVSSDGFVVNSLVKRGCNPNDIGYEKACALIMSGIEEILGEFSSLKSIFCGIAGISAEKYAERLHRDLAKRYPYVSIDIKTDSMNLFSLVKGVNMAIISGTGSVVFVKKGKDYARLGGWGYLLDSAGSAYDIGRDALRVALSEEDSRKSPSLLSKLLYERLNVGAVWNHIDAIYQGGKSYIASLASSVFEAYQKGDLIASEIIDGNAKRLAELLNDGVKLHGVAPVAIASGGVFEHYTEIMVKHIAKYSAVRLIVSDLPPIYGACINACLGAKCEIGDEFYNNFKNSYGEKTK